MKAGHSHAVPSSLPDGVVSLADHERHAQGMLDEGVWAWFNGGAADEVTLRANARAWQTMELLPRVMRQTTGGHTRV